MSLNPSPPSPPQSVDTEALRQALATPVPPGFANLHALNTTLDTSKNIPGVTGGIPKMYNVPEPFAKAQEVHARATEIENLLENPAVAGEFASAGVDLTAFQSALTSAKGAAESYQTEIIGDKNATPGQPGSAGFAKITENASMAAAVEGANAAQSGAATGLGLATANEEGGFLSGVCDFMNGLFDFLSGIGDAIGNIIGDAMSALGDLMGAIGDAISGALGAINDLISSVTDAIADALGAIFGAIGDAISAAVGAITDAVSAITDAIADVLSGLADGIGELIDFISSISLPGTSLNPCAKQGLAKVVSADGAEALNVSTELNFNPDGST